MPASTYDALQLYYGCYYTTTTVLCTEAWEHCRHSSGRADSSDSGSWRGLEECYYTCDGDSSDTFSVTSCICWQRHFSNCDSWVRLLVVVCGEQVLCLPASVSLCVCLHKILKTAVENRCNLVGICPIGSWWPLTLSYFHTFSIQAIYFEWLDLAIHFQFGDTPSEYLGHSSVSRSGPRSRSRQWKSSSVQLLTVGWKLLQFDRNICYDKTLKVIWSFDILTSRHFCIFKKFKFYVLNALS